MLGDLCSSGQRVEDSMRTMSFLQRLQRTLAPVSHNMLTRAITPGPANRQTREGEVELG